MNIYERVNKNTDKEDPVDVVYLDFQKASRKGFIKIKLPETIPGGILW